MTICFQANTAALESTSTAEADKMSPCRPQRRTMPRTSSSRQDNKRKRRRSPSPVSHLIMFPCSTAAYQIFQNDNMCLIHPSTHPSVPTIIISPSPPNVRETSCWVPLQDSRFSNQLTVPSYHCINDYHPPQIRPQQNPNATRHTGHPPLSAVERWKYEDGHWQAVLPSLEAQIQRGLFSRPIIHKRRVVLNGS